MAIITDSTAKIGAEIRVVKIYGCYTRYSLRFISDGTPSLQSQVSEMEDYEKPYLILLLEKMAAETKKAEGFWNDIEYGQTVAVYANQALPFQTLSAGEESDALFYDGEASLIITDGGGRHETPYGSAVILRIKREALAEAALHLRAEWEALRTASGGESIDV